MKNNVKFAAVMALACAVVMTACSGGGSQPAPTQAAQTQAAAPAETPAAAQAETAAPAAPAAESVTLKFPHIFPDGDPIADTLTEFFKPELEKRTEGRVIVELYPNSTLAGEEGIYEGLRNDTYEMGITANVFQDRVPQIAITQHPFLFSDFATAKKFLCDEGWGEKLAAPTKELGFTVRGFSTQGFRVMTLNQKIESLDGFKGFKLRMPNYEYMVKTGESLGCAVTAMAMSEVFSALEQHVIDGQENPPSTIRSMGWYEVQDYLLVTNHVFTPVYMEVNDHFFESLSADDQKALDDVIQETCDILWEKIEATTQDDLDYIASQGTEVYYPSDEFKAEMVEATSHVYDTIMNDNPDAKAFVEAVRAAK